MHSKSKLELGVQFERNLPLIASLSLMQPRFYQTKLKLEYLQSGIKGKKEKY